MVCCHFRACCRRPTTIWWLVMVRPVTVGLGWDSHICGRGKGGIRSQRRFWQHLHLGVSCWRMKSQCLIFTLASRWVFIKILFFSLQIQLFVCETTCSLCNFITLTKWQYTWKLSAFYQAPPPQCFHISFLLLHPAGGSAEPEAQFGGRFGFPSIGGPLKLRSSFKQFFTCIDSQRFVLYLHTSTHF